MGIRLNWLEGICTPTFRERLHCVWSSVLAAWEHCGLVLSGWNASALQVWESLSSYPAPKVWVQLWSLLPPRLFFLALGFLRVTSACVLYCCLSQLPFPSSASWGFFSVWENCVCGLGLKIGQFQQIWFCLGFCGLDYSTWMCGCKDWKW